MKTNRGIGSKSYYIDKMQELEELENEDNNYYDGYELMLEEEYCHHQQTIGE
jgi:hypothetical protein